MPRVLNPVDFDAQGHLLSCWCNQSQMPPQQDARPAAGHSDSDPDSDGPPPMVESSNGSEGRQAGESSDSDSDEAHVTALDVFVLPHRLHGRVVLNRWAVFSFVLLYRSRE